MIREIMIYVGLFVALILSWYTVWFEIPSKKVSECPGVEIARAELDFKSEWERESRIRVVKSLLSGYEKGFIVLSQQGLWDLKNELCKLTRSEKPVKIYPAYWTLEGYLEVVGK